MAMPRILRSDKVDHILFQHREIHIQIGNTNRRDYEENSEGCAARKSGTHGFRCPHRSSVRRGRSAFFSRFTCAAARCRTR